MSKVAMRVLRFVICGFVGFVLATLGYAIYYHFALVCQRQTAEEFIAAARKWKLNRTSEAELRQDMARFPKQREWCSEGTCTLVYDFDLNRRVHPGILQRLGIRWSQVAFEVSVERELLKDVFFKYETEYADGTFRAFEIAPPVYTVPDGRTTWVVQPHVTTVPAGSGSALLHLYSSGISDADWKRIWMINTPCISQWNPCRDEEVVPEAWKEYRKQSAEGAAYAKPSP